MNYVHVEILDFQVHCSTSLGVCCWDTYWPGAISQKFSTS